MFEKRSADLFKALSDDRVKAIQALRQSEEDYKNAGAVLDDARKNVTRLTGELARLKGKIQDHLSTGNTAAAQKLHQDVTEAQSALDMAQNIADSYAGRIEAMRLGIARREVQAEEAHKAAHRHLADQLREELVSDIRSKWVKAWRHNLAAGSSQTFVDFVKFTIGSEAHGGDLFTREVGVTLDENRPLSPLIGITERGDLRRKLRDTDPNRPLTLADRVAAEEAQRQTPALVEILA
jgi:hypothetical protein